MHRLSTAWMALVDRWAMLLVLFMFICCSCKANPTTLYKQCQQKFQVSCMDRGQRNVWRPAAGQQQRRDDSVTKQLCSCVCSTRRPWGMGRQSWSPAGVMAACACGMCGSEMHLWQPLNQ
jgi:hypothetical protein